MTRMSQKTRIPTDRDFKVLDYIRNYKSFYGITPTQEQIARHIRLHPTNNRCVVYILNKLERAGHIRRTPRLWHGIELVEPKNDNAAYDAAPGRTGAAR